MKEQHPTAEKTSAAPGAAAARAVAGHPLDALLPDICQLLDAVKVEWSAQGCWSEWDQSVRDRIAAYNVSRAALAACVTVQPTGEVIERDGFGPKTPLRWPAAQPTSAAPAAPPEGMTLRQRCDTALQCLPEAPLRAQLARLFEDLLAAPADLIAYMQGIYDYLQSTAPAGFADEAFRLPAAATRAQRQVFDALQGDASGERAAPGRQDQGDRPADGRAVGSAAPAPAGMPQPVALPAGWNFKRHEDGAVGAWKDGVGGWHARPEADSIAEAILWELANDLLAATPPTPASEVAQDAARLRKAIQSIEDACIYSPHREAGTWDDGLAQLIHHHARFLPDAALRNNQGERNGD